MTNDHTGRTPRQTTGGSPAASTVMIVVTVVAIVVGFFILKQIRDDGGSASSALPPSATQPSNETTTTAAGQIDVTTTTAQVDVKTGTKVQVANSSSGQGVAGKLTKDLQANGFQTGKATDATGANVAASVVYYDPASPSGKQVADTVARSLGGVTVEPLPAAIPITGGQLDTGVGVLVLLGNDKAGKTIAEMSGGAAATTSSLATVATVATTSSVPAG